MMINESVAAFFTGFHGRTHGDGVCRLVHGRSTTTPWINTNRGTARSFAHRILAKVLTIPGRGLAPAFRQPSPPAQRHGLLREHVAHFRRAGVGLRGRPGDGAGALFPLPDPARRLMSRKFSTLTQVPRFGGTGTAKSAAAISAGVSALWGPAARRR